MKSTKLVLIVWCGLTLLIAVCWFLVATASFLAGVPGFHAEWKHLAFLWLVLSIPIVLFVLAASWVMVRWAMRPAKDLLLLFTNPFPNSTDFADPDYRVLAERIVDLLNEQQRLRTRLDQVSGRVAHELRNPLALMRLQVDYAMRGLEPLAIKRLEAQIQRLSDYVDIALFLARGDKGRPSLKKERTNLSILVGDILKEFEPMAQEKRRQFLPELESEIFVEIDQRILRLILNNLISNAISHGKGTIRARLRRGHENASLIFVNEIGSGGYSLFEAGTGFGLETVAALCSLHGGLDFRTRQGSYFISRLKFLSKRSPNAVSASLPV